MEDDSELLLLLLSFDDNDYFAGKIFDSFAFFFFSFYLQHSLPVHMHVGYIFFASFGAGCIYFSFGPCSMYQICIENIDL